MLFSGELLRSAGVPQRVRAASRRSMLRCFYFFGKMLGRSLSGSNRGDTWYSCGVNRRRGPFEAKRREPNEKEAEGVVVSDPSSEKSSLRLYLVVDITFKRLDGGLAQEFSVAVMGLIGQTPRI